MALSPLYKNEILVSFFEKESLWIYYLIKMPNFHDSIVLNNFINVFPSSILCDSLRSSPQFSRYVIHLSLFIRLKRKSVCRFILWNINSHNSLLKSENYLFLKKRKERSLQILCIFCLNRSYYWFASINDHNEKAILWRILVIDLYKSFTS